MRGIDTSEDQHIDRRREPGDKRNGRVGWILGTNTVSDHFRGVLNCSEGRAGAVPSIAERGVYSSTWPLNLERAWIKTVAHIYLHPPPQPSESDTAWTLQLCEW